MLQAFGNGTLFGETYGSGPVRVVWLHGWGRSSADFAASAQELANAGIASVALDLPGFGASPLPTVAGGARLYADLLWPTLSTMSDEPLVLVGHSFGGRVATVLAALHPDAWRAVVLTGVPLLRTVTSSKSPLAYRVIRALAKRGLISPTRLEAARQKYGSADYRAAHGLLREILVATVNEEYSTELSLITTPTTFLWGSADTAASADMAERATALVPGPTTWQLLEGVGHLIPTSAPQQLSAAVREAVV